MSDLQYSLCPHLTSGDGKRKRIRRRQDWINYANNGRFPQDETLRRVDAVVEGSMRQALSPFWMLLESEDPLREWRRQVQPRLMAHIRGKWIRLQASPVVGSELMRDWMREASKRDTIEALCLLSGLYLVLDEKGQQKKAELVARAMIRALIIEHSRFPIRPYLEQIFDVCRITLWRNLGDDYFSGYDFRGACATANAIMEFSERRFPVEFPFDQILLPGSMWANLGPRSGSGTDFLRIGFVHHDPDAFWLRPLTLAGWPHVKERVGKTFFLERLTRSDGSDTRMLIRQGEWVDGKSDLYWTVTFVGRKTTDSCWTDNSYSAAPSRYFECSRGILSLVDRHVPSKPIFPMFPRASRMLRVGKDFQPL